MKRQCSCLGTHEVMGLGRALPPSLISAFAGTQAHLAPLHREEHQPQMQILERTERKTLMLVYIGSAGTTRARECVGE